jgi:hypothetical protein
VRGRAVRRLSDQDGRRSATALDQPDDQARLRHLHSEVALRQLGALRRPTPDPSHGTAARTAPAEKI